MEGWKMLMDKFEYVTRVRKCQRGKARVRNVSLIPSDLIGERSNVCTE